MRISQLIERLEKIKEEKGDIPVCIRDASEAYRFSFMEVATTTYFYRSENKKSRKEGYGIEHQIYEFVGLSYE